MAGPPGRPRRGETRDSRQVILDATVAIIKERGAGAVRVRDVCERAGVSTGTFYHHFENKDDLLMFFVRDGFFPATDLRTPRDDPAGRIVELYSSLMSAYVAMGEDFMKSFYTTDNAALSASFGQTDGRFPPGSVMAVSEEEITVAVSSGLLPDVRDVHQAAADICTLVKGCVFEWCLSGADLDLGEMIDRLIRDHLRAWGLRDRTR